jgi:nitroreductase
MRFAVSFLPQSLSPPAVTEEAAMTKINSRAADYPIDTTFLERWSPRAFTGEPMAEADLLTMLEAARWAPSSYNSQPWRFIYARRDTPHWQPFLDLLVPNNRAWAKDASALIILISNSLMRPPGAEKEARSPTHSLDAGTASGYFALQAHKMGWFAHGMVGFDRERAFGQLDVPRGYEVEAVYAVGRIGDPSNLSEALEAREHPSTRLQLEELAFEGSFERRRR